MGNKVRMNYKVGESVRVRHDINHNYNYGGDSVMKDMEQYRGQIFVVKELIPLYNRTGTYYELDGAGRYTWSYDMLEPVLTRFTKSDIIVGKTLLKNRAGIIKLVIAGGIAISETGKRTKLEWYDEDLKRISRIPFPYNKLNDLDIVAVGEIDWSNSHMFISRNHNMNDKVKWTKLPELNTELTVREIEDKLNLLHGTLKIIGGKN